MLISDIIGHVDVFNGQTHKGLPISKRDAALNRARTACPLVQIRARSADQIEMIPREFLDDIRGLVSDLQSRRAMRIVLNRRANPSTRRMEVDTFDVVFNEDGIASVPFDVALILLSRDRYRRLVEEVSTSVHSGENQARVPMTPAEARDFADLKERLESKEAMLDARLAQLEALLTQHSQPTQTTPDPTPRGSRSSKRGQ